jgi:hypothetical protein
MSTLRRSGSRGRIWLPVIILIAAGAVVLSLVYTPPADEPVPDIQEAGEPDSALAMSDSVSILILNGAGIDDLARTVQRYLTRQGMDCVFYAPGDPSNADRMDYEVTIIVSHLQDLSGAVMVAEELGLTDSSVVWQLPLEGHPPVDVTVYLGRDVSGRSFVPYSN